MATIIRAIFFTLCAMYASSQNCKYLAVVPEVVQVGVEQAIVVSVFTAVVPVQVKVETFDGFVVYDAGVTSVNKIQRFIINIPCDKLPPLSQNGEQYLYVRILSNDSSCSFNERRRVVLTLKSMSVFVQTDKPVYRRDDNVHIRFVAVGPDLLPLDESAEITIDIKNPQNVIADRINLEAASSDSSSIKDHTIKLGHKPIFGTWTISAKYGCNKMLVSDFHFEVKDYVLPRFEVIIKPPQSIQATSPHIEVELEARYTYGKPVVGKLNVTLGFTEENSTSIQRFRSALFDLAINDKGIKKVSFPNDGFGPFPEGKFLYIYAEVTEKASGISQSNTDRSARFTANPITLKCISPPFYKPSLPYRLEIETLHANGVKAKRVPVVITLHTGKEEKLASDDSGIVAYTLTNDQASEITIRAHAEGQEVVEECVLQPSVHECSYFMLVRAKDQVPLEKGRQAEFEIVENDNANDNFDFHVTIMSCGKIQANRTIQNKNGPATTFQVYVDEKFCSQLCVAVYYSSDCADSPIVADSTCAAVEEKCANDMSIHLSARDNTIQPGEDTEITVSAAPHSHLALLAVDKGLYLLNNETKLTKKEIFKDLETYDKSCGYRQNSVEGILNAIGLTSRNSTRETEKCSTGRQKRRASQSEDCLCELGKKVRRLALESVSAENAEKILIDECNAKYRNLSSSESTMPRTCPVLTSKGLSLFLRCCAPQSELKQWRQRSGNTAYEILEFEDPSFFQKRTYFPHVWLLDSRFRTNSEGQFVSTIHVPDSITEWVIQGLAFSKKGFGAADPVSLTAFKSVFVECHLPFSLHRQEQVTIACTAYNYQTRRIKACLRLHNPDEDMCTTAGAGKSTTPICFHISEQSTETVLFPVVPLKTGISKLTVRLTTELAGEDVETEIRVEPEGVLREYSYSAELDPLGSNAVSSNCNPPAPQDYRKGSCYKGSTCLNEEISKNTTKADCCDKKIVDFSVAWSDGTKCELCSSETFNRFCANSGKKQVNAFYVRLPENYVAGSDSAWLSVTGKYFEGTLKAVESVEDLLREPGGCGEQSIARFAPNVAIVKHLNATGELFVEVRSKYVDLIQRGYQYQLRYRKPSGAFAKYPHTEASTWLSAFVLQTFCDAKDFAVIDENVIRGLITFLTLPTRRLLSGAFLETYTTSSYLIGGVRPGDASLTAYVVNAALQCCQALNHALFTPDAKDAFCKAVSFLELYILNDAVVRSYSRALVYAALVKACTTCEFCSCRAGILQKARAMLDAKAVVRADGAKFWLSDSGAEEVISVETTAYALCGYVEEGHLKSAGPLAKYLNTKRNSAGAFRSTQDTVVALRCLGQFASALKFSRSLTVSVTATHNKDLSRVIQITDANKDLDQKIEIPRNDIIKVETQGNGLGMLQVNVQYNEPSAENEECKFNFTVTPENVNGDDDESAILLNVCAQYTGNVDTDQAIIEVELPTGYVSCKEGNDHCLKELNETQGQAFNLDEFETTGRGVIFYFDQIGSTPENRTCFKFRIDRQYEARSLTSVSAKVYYYYRREESCTVFYTLDGATPDLAVLCNDRDAGKEPLCVCGAGRCPRLEEISRRLCNACEHHDYVYRIEVKNIQKVNGWRKIIVNIADILKPGRHDIKQNEKVVLWMPESCSQTVSFKKGKHYHLQGIDGIKFVLDHTTHIEPWPADLSSCKQKAKRECQKIDCAKKRNNKKNSCIKDCLPEKEKKCKKDTKSFLKYVSQLKDENGAECESSTVCK